MGSMSLRQVEGLVQDIERTLQRAQFSRGERLERLAHPEAGGLDDLLDQFAAGGGQFQPDDAAVFGVGQAGDQAFMDQHIHNLADSRAAGALGFSQFADRGLTEADVAQHVKLLDRDIELGGGGVVDLLVQAPPQRGDGLPEAVESLLDGGIGFGCSHIYHAFGPNS